MAPIQATLQKKINDTVATQYHHHRNGDGFYRTFRLNHHPGARGGHTEIQAGDHYPGDGEIAAGCRRPGFTFRTTESPSD
ncbi:hypothetical protein NHX12_028048 [Muraenolepis orangiensis]|uniref:Uncharacterized protein n=1 Tax=Muraenolepis orangiensis TaxID=630683 RepID=A0A9Q0EII9_9TELE|nr:hypothetical protein NHX12_028048 [Muraenolepis orangiensis]